MSGDSAGGGGGGCGICKRFVNVPYTRIIQFRWSLNRPTGIHLLVYTFFSAIIGNAIVSWITAFSDCEWVCTRGVPKFMPSFPEDDKTLVAADTMGTPMNGTFYFRRRSWIRAAMNDYRNQLGFFIMLLRAMTLKTAATRAFRSDEIELQSSIVVHRHTR